MTNTIIELMRNFTNCPNRIIDALAENLCFSACYDVLAAEHEFRHQEFEISDDGSIRIYTSCDCEYHDCEHREENERKESEMNDRLQELMIGCADEHFRLLKKENPEEWNWSVPYTQEEKEAMDKYIEKL